jgi:hypothetical protein
VRGAAIPAIAPHLRLIDALRQQCLGRRAHALTSREVIKQSRRVAPVEATGIELACDRLECSHSGATLLEHASSRAEN